ncbi:anti-sigma F factor [Candidatus Epulonipiscium fishelsonii]|uniref:Anti-sigma F factor n=1 Tax=Candidatus Epulonipiscium fishelsonii TaxID=77094 RepID=A0ACC8XDQ1_9FIRM|nr:anti-sigma F factor [Epulopiscium sp. SCG-B05WGA-EpuloA1]ONI41021.1 anti-sigma F factor [Epulopiscium sp. SCG-B11WGA-EpuloA1]ONI47403.1 anti-sigma F factor [Epulopiscium sp. SCG-C06WGA-EpuloA1]
MYQNQMVIQFKSQSINESFARAVVSSFLSQLDPTVEQLHDIKTAVSEAVTNCIIHGYDSNPTQDVKVFCGYYMNGQKTKILIEVVDMGKGIEDVEQAKEPLFTTSEDLDRAGLGFTVMESMMDSVSVKSKLGEGTTVTLEIEI